jgi:hypothetical protein
MFDIFYIGSKLNLFPYEQAVENLDQAQQLSRTRYCWVIHYLLDLSDFDFLWEPPPWQSWQRHAWPSQHQKDAGIYLVPKNWNGQETNYHSAPTIQRLPNLDTWDNTEFDFDYSWHPDPTEPPMTYQFGTQWQKTGGPQYRVPNAQHVKYVDKPRVIKTTVDPNWQINSDVQFENFDYTWHPDATDPPYIYQFATQHQKTGGPKYHVPGATEVKYLENIHVRIEAGSVPVVEIDHMDGSAGKIPNTVKRIRYFDNYRDTLIRLAKSLVGQYDYVWVCSSICDYTNFDFSWHPEQWQGTMLHVFASNDQKFGDTFLMHVPTFAERAEKKALLEWYSVNFVPGIQVPRRPIPVIQHHYDSHADAVKNIEFSAPLALFTVEEQIDSTTITVPLWRQETKTITPISKGATAIIMPRTAVGDVQTQLYDYPYIDKTTIMLSSQPLDIVFISNGESNAEDNFQWLLQVTNANMNSNLNRIHRVDGVNGRVAAYHAAARASTTPWFFAVFAKLHVNKDFDWSWQPDRMQQAKHYIFHAENAVNGLIYGHQAMIAYNKKLVLENTGVGLDFTLDSPHEVVPILSGTAHYSGSAWSAWRTAFREALKLRVSLPDVENEYRLNQWLGKDNTIEHWSQKGAQDAMQYYEDVDGDFDALKKSYEWQWLASYAFMKRSLTPDQ